MRFSAPELVAGLTAPDLPTKAFHELLALLACIQPAFDPLPILHQVALTSEPPRIRGLDEGPGESPAPPVSVRRRRARRWAIPPAMLREPDESFDGMPILHESEGDFGVLLWQVFRDVSLWAQTPPEKRGELFGPTAASRRREALSRLTSDRRLEVWLAVLSAVLEHPDRVSSRCLAVACIEVSRHAARAEQPRTSLSFALAAAQVLPDHPVSTLEVSSAALRAHRLVTAEVWARRALALGRRHGDWRTYAEAMLDLGTLANLKADACHARTYYVKAIRVGRRKSYADVRAAANFGLFRLAMEYGPLDRAERYAREVVRLLGRGNPESAPIYADVVALLISDGQLEEASRLLHRVLSRRSTPAPSRARALALSSRISALKGDKAGFLRAYTDTLGPLEEVFDPIARGKTVLELVRAALLVEDRARARHAATLCRAPEGICDPRFTERIAEALDDSGA